MRSVFALVVFIFGCYYFEPYMIPAIALLILLKYYLVRHYRAIYTFLLSTLFSSFVLTHGIATAA